MTTKAPETKVKQPGESFFKRLVRQQLFIPFAALALLVIFNLIADPSFFAVSIKENSLGNPVLSGNIISVLDNASELVILAIGMTLVTASSGGQDISVGATMAIAAWINNNQLPIMNDITFKYAGTFLPGIPVPTPIFITIFMIVLFWLVLKFTTLGLYTQSVGINAGSSRLNGLDPQMIKLLTYVILGVCGAVAGFIRVSRSGSINYSRIAENIEMDAILAVALGGNALSGGKFNIYGSILGAYVIQFLTTTLYKYEVPSTALPAYKAVVVILLVVLSAPVVREKLSSIKKAPAKAAKEVS